ncbi:hypothetical protein D6779_05865 [Candidatus Parcubacteria bacterium]|nr:MAG: hypothetical protein D6779_05865 [Candidatus Parcubacteria bacterium]
METLPNNSASKVRAPLSMKVFASCLCGIVIFVLAGGILLTLRRWQSSPSALWDQRVYDLPAFYQASPCVQAMLFVEMQPQEDRKVEPFSPYRLPVGRHVFHAEPREITQCMMEIGDVLFDMAQSESLSPREEVAVQKRMLGVLEVVCSPDFESFLTSAMKQQRWDLLERFKNLPDDYREIILNVDYLCTDISP